MPGRRCFRALFLSLSTLVFAVPRGTVPSSDPFSYPAHVEQDGIVVGAKMLTSSEARKIFVSDVSRCCVVVEVAVYPRKNKALEVSLNDIVLEVKGTDAATRPSTPKVVAASLQQKAQDEHDVTVSPSVGVGYSSGTVYDPAYGSTRGSGVYTTAGVGVGVDRGTDPGSTSQDRAAMETELSEKGLPEGGASSPVAGYLYFALRPNKKATYQLQYLLEGQQVLLTLK